MSGAPQRFDEDVRRNLKQRLDDCRGQGLAEYIIVAILVAIILIVAVRYFGSSVSNQFESATSEISSLDKGSSSTEASSADDSSDAGKSGAARRYSGQGGDEYDESSARSKSSQSSASSGAKSGGAGGGGGSDEEDLTAALGKDGVGMKETDPAGDIFIDSQTLWFLGLVIVAAGIGIAMHFGKDRKKGKKKEDKKKTKKGKRNPFSRSKDSDGQAMVEFLFVAITFLFTILGVIQLAMCLNAYALVRYAAYNAARAAVVHGADEDKMLEAARVSLLAVFPRHGRADTGLGMTQNYIAALATDELPIFSYYLEPITEVSIVDNFNASGVITFDDPEDFDKAFLTVQVVHRYELVIPLVNRIIFFIYKLWREEGGRSGRDLLQASAETDRLRRTGDFQNIEYRIPLVAHYTMRLHTDYEAG